ncbi:hypothetical protein FO519_005816 [Halicephalobus sp. NKZ332]|nr:hypothetical protein FO519_005816 [Halicephalobus sp. NKZ332]
MKNLILFFCTIGITVASYCGQSGIPFSLEAGIDGQPILGCARPSCFGWDAEGKRAADSAQFYKINKKADGFLRSTDTKGPVISNATNFRPQYAFCERTYYWNQCQGTNQWIGGIVPLSKINSESVFQVLCCTYDRLSEAVDQGTAQIKPGQAVVGGEIKGDDGRQHSFEYISNIQRTFDENGKVIYHVNMKRFPCLPEPFPEDVKVEDGTSDFLVQNINKELKVENIQFAAKTAESGTPIGFDQTKFDLPKNMPNEEFQSLPKLPTEASKEPKRTSDGRVIPSAKAFVDAPEQVTLTPYIPQNSNSPQNYNSQVIPQSNYNYNYYQHNLLDPFGLFQQRSYSAPTAPQTSQYPAPSAPQPSQYAAPTVSQVSSSSIPGSSGQYQQVYPQSYSHSLLWPFYSYSQNPSASYGVQNQVAPVQPLPSLPTLPSHGSNTLAPAPHPKPIPLTIPSVEEVEKAIPETGRRMIVRVARTLLGL